MKSSGKKVSDSDAKRGMTRRELLKTMAVSGPLLKAGMALKSKDHIVSIREDRYKLAEYYSIAPSQCEDYSIAASQWEMYDRLKDPLETQNIAWPTFQRTREQQKEFERLQEKLQLVQATRLQSLG